MRRRARPGCGSRHWRQEHLRGVCTHTVSHTLCHTHRVPARCLAAHSPPAHFHLLRAGSLTAAAGPSHARARVLLAHGNASPRPPCSRRCLLTSSVNPPQDCTIKKPYWGDGTNRRARWCGSCATNHENATELHKRSCEDCVVKAPSYGMPDPAKPGVLPVRERSAVFPRASAAILPKITQRLTPLLVVLQRRRWCAACRVNHPGSIQSNGSKCQECATKSAKIGLVTTTPSHVVDCHRF